MAQSTPVAAGDTAGVPKLKRTPLYSTHRRLGAKIVEFAGWQMPVQYSGIIEEHLAVRARAGLFDVSHMGEIEVRGPDALDLCQKITCNDVSRVHDLQAQYNLLLNDGGGIVDDIVVHRLTDQYFMICVNASNAHKDFSWIKGHAEGRVEVIDKSADYAQLALQGPLAERILQRITTLDLPAIRYYRFAFGEVAGVHCLAARTGYTGEDGFELYCESERAVTLWDVLMDAGRDLGLLPAGLGARDTLRLERALPLYGHELDETTTPFEAGLDWVVKPAKGPFVGRESLQKQQEQGVARKLVGLEMTDAGIGRSHCAVLKDGRAIGVVTSGTKSPTLKKSIAMAYVPTEEAAVGNRLEVEIRGRKVAAAVVPLPFYRRTPAEKGR
jgi:aminomethyltransferase